MSPYRTALSDSSSPPLRRHDGAEIVLAIGSLILIVTSLVGGDGESVAGVLGLIGIVLSIQFAAEALRERHRR